MDNRDQLLVKVALLYYEEEINQTNIAKTLNISRPTVASLLKEAKEKGIIKISIQYEEINNLKAKEKIKQHYNLKSVLIANESSTEESISMVGKLGLEFIESKLENIESLGIGMGRTLYEFVSYANYNNIKNLEIIPLIGGVGLSEINLHANHLAFALAQKYDCNVSYFYAPAVTDSLELKENLEESSFIQEMYKKANNVDYAVVSVGTTFESSSFSNIDNFKNMFKPAETDTKAVGNLLGTFFDSDGKIVDTSITNRTIALKLDSFKNIPNKVILASNTEKGPAVAAALKLKLIDHLIIDSEITKFLINEIESSLDL